MNVCIVITYIRAFLGLVAYFRNQRNQGIVCTEHDNNNKNSNYQQ